MPLRFAKCTFKKMYVCKGNLKDLKMLAGQVLMANLQITIILVVL